MDRHVVEETEPVERVTGAEGVARDNKACNWGAAADNKACNSALLPEGLGPNMGGRRQ